jgi:hypothetical protein
MSVESAIRDAEWRLPGEAAPEGEKDPRWQAIIEVGEYTETDPEPIWTFVDHWGRSHDADLRTAIATCLLEHLLEHHFDTIFPRVNRSSSSLANSPTASRPLGRLVKHCCRSTARGLILLRHPSERLRANERCC